jgi:Subtilase family
MLKDVYSYYYHGQAIALKTNFNLVGIATKQGGDSKFLRKSANLLIQREKKGSSLTSQCHYYKNGFVKFYSFERQKALETYFDGIDYQEIPMFGTEYCCIGPNNGIVVKFKKKTSMAEAAGFGEKHKLLLDKSEPLEEYLPNTFLFQQSSFNPEGCFDVSRRIWELEQDRIEYVEPDFLGKLMLAMPPATPGEVILQWALADTSVLPANRRDLRVVDAWTLIQNRIQSADPISVQPVNIAIVDDGLFPHIDILSNNILPGKNYTSNIRAQTTPTNANDVHGSQIGGLLAAAHNGDRMAGIGFAETSSISPSCKIIPVRVCYDGGHFVTSSKIAFGIAFAAENARIVNMSFNFIPDFPGLETVENAITRRKDTLFVASAGNFFPSDGADQAVLFPATIADVLTVGAHDRTGVWKNINNPVGSNWGSRIGTSLDVCAPGVDVTGTITGNNLSSNFGGTSAAAAFVSGVAGLILAVNPSLTPVEVVQIIKSTAIDDLAFNGAPPNPADRAKFVGAGRVNALEAVSKTLG